MGPFPLVCDHCAKGSKVYDTDCPSQLALSSMDTSTHARVQTHTHTLANARVNAQLDGDVTSILLYACESCTLTVELQRRIRAMEMRCYHKILYISYKGHVTDEEVHANIQQATGPHEDLLTIVKRRKLCFPFIRSGQNHLARHSERGKTKQTEEEVGREHQGVDRPGVRKVWKVPEGSGEQRLEDSGCEVICGVPTTPAVKG